MTVWESPRSLVSTTATVAVVVNPRWRVLHAGRVYEAGELAELPLLLAAEWSGWGSVTPAHRVAKAGADGGPKVRGWAV